MAGLNLQTPIQYVPGVGPRRAALFEDANLRTLADLLEYFPFRHDLDRGDVSVAELRPGAHASVRGEIIDLGGYGRGRWAELHDETGSCRLRWFNPPRQIHGLSLGAIVRASGKVQEYDDWLELVQPQLQPVSDDSTARRPGTNERLVGVYRAVGELKSATIRRAVEAALRAELPAIDDALPASLRRRHHWPARGEAIRCMHQPGDEKALERARRRLAYEEFLLIELAMALRRKRSSGHTAGRRLAFTAEIDERICARFPFALTASQRRVVDEICTDLASGHAMTRLLQGDVGSGKTVVALYACLLAVAHTRQAVLMAPTEILAQQHFSNIERYLAGSRVRRALLRGGLPTAQRDALRNDIESGNLDLVVGTQALLEQDVAFSDLALVIVDEQHKFGVLQRANLRTKGPLPHYLVMTATPIPRTLAMTVFGDLDVSVLDGMPPGRGRITTRLVRPIQWPTVMKQIRARLEAGEQAYVVCPLIGEDVDADQAALQAAPAPAAAGPRRVSAVEMFRRLNEGAWKGLPIGLLHGGMKSAEKSRAIGDFASGRLRALVATTVVEVGVDVPSATIMIVENAEAFGLSQLHQLRGRVGRGTADSQCVLIARGHGAKGEERLSTLVETTDGFRIAEADLRLRGPGELLGTRQHGLPELKVGDLLADFELLETARQDAFALVAADPELSSTEHRPLWPALRRMFADRLSLLDAG